VTDVLSLRALNRATLARQLLLARSELPVLATVARLVGLQAQEPPDPYIGLWSRLADFRPEELGALLLDRRVVRIAVMRSTLHLVTADDCLVLRPLMQPVLDAELARHREYAPALVGVNLEAVLAFGREFLAEPRTGRELRAAFAERFPEHEPAALAYACRNHLGVVQVPPRGVWGQTGGVVTTTVEAWLGRPLESSPSLDHVVVRYLGAFGPATVADVAAWSRLTGLRQVVERLRPRLRTFRDERGRELFDLPDAPRPGPDVPAPVRFLPGYDNLLLSHADRTRFAAPGRRELLGRVTGRVNGTVLVDGTVAAVWQLERGRLVVSHAPLTKRAAASVAAEGRRFLRWVAPDVRDVRLVAIS
jgi:Winged helix DNA-binding domain